jgi:hypothetical protein
MNVHDRLIYAGHEEPPRAATRTRREGQAPRARRAASPSDARTDRVPAWYARALRFRAGPAIHPKALSQVLDDCPAGLVITWEQERRRLRSHWHDGLRREQIGRPRCQAPRWPSACTRPARAWPACPWRSRRPWCCTSAAVRGHWCADDPVEYTNDPGGTDGRAG